MLDGGTLIGSGPVVTHTFAIQGVYAVTLSVTDDDGAEHSTAVTFQVLAF